MPSIRKITYGWVTQEWDADTDEFLGQEFTCGDTVEHEDENGNPVKASEPHYRCYDMVQDPQKV